MTSIRLMLMLYFFMVAHKAACQALLNGNELVHPKGGQLVYFGAITL